MRPFGVPVFLLLITVFEIVSCSQFDVFPRKNHACCNHDKTCGKKKWLDALSNNKFPDEFFFGVSTSAYQTEGAWNLSGKGQSVWDDITHNNQHFLKDEQNADIAADFYHKYKEDIQLAKSIGSTMFRISISWTRILPNGFSNEINREGIYYYDNVINEMIENGITPMITLLHGDLPSRLQKWGGLLNSLFIDWFADYARIAFANFGDRVKHWITINDPVALCKSLYGGGVSSVLNESGTADYYCLHYALLAHSRVYHMYRQEFFKHEGEMHQQSFLLPQTVVIKTIILGKIGISHDFRMFVPVNVTSDADKRANRNAFMWYNDWLLNPIFSKEGDYPNLMKHQIGLKSRLEGFPKSRLPTFTKSEIHRIKGSADFLGINVYLLELAESTTNSDNQVSFRNDAEVKFMNLWNKYTEFAFRDLLKTINSKPHIPEVYITENGYPDSEGLRDINKAMYLRTYLLEVLNALKNGMNIRGYLVWSLLDSFEWAEGYRYRYGLFHVDFKDPSRTRTPRLSSKLIAKIYKERTLDDSMKFLGLALQKNITNSDSSEINMIN